MISQPASKGGPYSTPSIPAQGSRVSSSLRPGADHLRALFRNVNWSVSYVAFLVFIFVILTYRLDVGDIAMAVALAGLVFEKRGPRLPLPLVLFAGYVLWGFFGLLGTAFPESASDRLLDFVRLWLIFLVAVNVLTSESRIRFFLVFFLVLFVTHPARGAVFNKFLYGFAEFGRVAWRDLFGNPNDLAALSFLPLGIAASLLQDRNRWIRWGSRAAVVGLPCLVFLTQSRGGILGLGVFGILILARNRRRLRTIALVGLSVLAVVFTAPTGAWERMEGLTHAVRTGEFEQADEYSSAEQRLTIWEVAVDVARDHPLDGVGLGNYPKVHEVRAASRAEWALARGDRDVHSTFLGVLVETGIPGLLLFLALLIVVARTARKARRRYPEAAAADKLRYMEYALYAFLMAALFGTYHHISFFYIHLAFLVALASETHRQGKLLELSMGRTPPRRSRRRGMSALESSS